MKVEAKCCYRVWDGAASVLHLPGQVVTIDHDGSLAHMKIGDDYVFQFDRTMQGTGLEPAVGGYKCKLCRKSFDTLAQHGNHHYAVHSRQYETAEIDDSEPIVTERRGRKQGQKYACKECGEEFPHLYAMGKHKCPALAVEVAS